MFVSYRKQIYKHAKPKKKLMASLNAATQQQIGAEFTSCFFTTDIVRTELIEYDIISYGRYAQSDSMLEWCCSHNIIK